MSRGEKANSGLMVLVWQGAVPENNMAMIAGNRNFQSFDWSKPNSVRTRSTGARLNWMQSGANGQTAFYDFVCEWPASGRRICACGAFKAFEKLPTLQILAGI